MPAPRPTVWLGIVLLSAQAAAGQSAPYLAVVTTDTLAVRAAPGDDAPETDALRKGEQVVVRHEENGRWLAVQPPSGAISWISHTFVELPDAPAGGPRRNAVVHSDGEVRLAAGRFGVDRPLAVRKAAVPNGTVVKVIGPKVFVEDEKTHWYPILPTDGDLRYVPKEAVRTLGPAAGESFVVTSPPVKDPAVVPAGATPAEPVTASVPGPRGGVNHDLWAKAEAAERAGRLDDAERLYFELARQMNAPGGSPETANLCYTRIHAVRERRRQGQGGTGAGVAWSSGSGTPAAGRREEPREDDNPRRAASGFVRLAPFTINNRKTYKLEDQVGNVKYYLVPAAGSGVELGRYEKTWVDVTGSVSRPAELGQVGLVAVTKVERVR